MRKFLRLFFAHYLVPAYDLEMLGLLMPILEPETVQVTEETESEEGAVNHEAAA
jgi:hypothetical protein